MLIELNDVSLSLFLSLFLSQQMECAHLSLILDTSRLINGSPIKVLVVHSLYRQFVMIVMNVMRIDLFRFPMHFALFFICFQIRIFRILLSCEQDKKR
jgi:hypothetical protein